MLSSDPPRYLPFLTEPRMLGMGLGKLDPAKWIEPDADLAGYHANKLQQRATLGDRVYAALPQSVPAQQELRELLLSHLLTQHAHIYQRNGDTLTAPGLQLALDGTEPLWQASLWVQEDLCLLQPRDSSYHLTAASLCAPSYWRLEEKIGRSLAQIHGPVPGYEQALEEQVSRFFRFIKPQQPVWRANWSVVADDALLQRGNEGDSPGVKGLFLRVERQTLRRLPETDAVVFTIRVYLHPLSDIRTVPGAVRALETALEGLRPDERAYKSVAGLGAQLALELASWR